MSMSRTHRTKDPYGWDRDVEWKKTRDKKRWNKANSTFKQIKQTERRAQDHAAIKKLNMAIDPDEIIMPEHPKSNDWDWN
jgi:hypothetical protein